MLKEIVVGVDGSDAAAVAVAWAAEVAAVVDAEVVVTAAWAPDEAEVPPDRYQALRAEATDRLEQEWSRPAQQLGRRCRSVLAEEEPADGILNTAVAEHAEMIVVGAAGHDGPFHLGSVTHQLAHHTTKPLAVVPPSAAPSAPRRIVLGVDGSPGSAAAVAFCAELAGVLGATTTAVLAREPLAERLPVVDAGPWRERAATDLATWTAPFEAAGIPVERRLVEGHDPAAAITRAAQADHADLVVVGSHGLSDVTGLRLGGVAVELINQADRPVVLLVPSPSSP